MLPVSAFVARLAELNQPMVPPIYVKLKDVAMINDWYQEGLGVFLWESVHGLWIAPSQPQFAWEVRQLLPEDFSAVIGRLVASVFRIHLTAGVESPYTLKQGSVKKLWRVEWPHRATPIRWWEFDLDTLSAHLWVAERLVPFRHARLM